MQLAGATVAKLAAITVGQTHIDIFASIFQLISSSFYAICYLLRC